MCCTPPDNSIGTPFVASDATFAEGRRRLADYVSQRFVDECKDTMAGNPLSQALNMLIGPKISLFGRLLRRFLAQLHQP
jgi:hypothetical protein